MTLLKLTENTKNQCSRASPSTVFRRILTLNSH